MASNHIYNPHFQQSHPGSSQPIQQTADGHSYASRSANAYVNSAGVPPHQPAVNQYQQSLPPHTQPTTQSFQQPQQPQQYYTPAPSLNSSQQQQTVEHNSHNPQYGRIPSPYHNPNPVRPDTKAIQSQQNLLDTSIRRMQEATHIMRGAMDADDLATTLDRAAAMLGELGDPKHHHHHHHGHGHHNQSHGHSSSSSPTAVMSPKHYYEIHMLAMEELPNIEEYFISLSSGPTPQYSMKDLYEITQYTSRAVPRLYLQICAGSALIRSGEEDVTNVLNDLIQAVKCVQCPIRGLFLRDYLLKAVRDKLPDEAEIKNQQPAAQQQIINEQSEADGGLNDTLTSLMGDLTMNTNDSAGLLENDTNMTGTIPVQNSGGRPRGDSFDNSSGQVKDSYQFVLANFIEMNKLWVRIQHLPGDAKNKETKRRRERERNELRMMVGTNLVRLSELEGVTSTIYGTVILPRILDQIVACRDPLAQAYLMDCIIQVFPDEFHIQTLEVVLGVCPNLREKVNIRTILQSIMDRLSNYYADELLLNDEEDTEGVKTSVMLDSFEIFDECVRAVLEGRGAKINAKEVIRLESSLLDFSLKCYPGRMDHINRCLGVCAACLRGQGTSNSALTTESGIPTPIPIDEVAIKELETLLSLPLETMGLNVLDLDKYSELLQFLPLDHRKRVALELLNVLDQSGETMSQLSEIEQLLSIVSPLIWIDTNASNISNSSEEKESVSKLIHLLYNEDTDIHFEILNFVKKYLFSSGGGIQACSYTVSPLFYSSMKLLNRVQSLEFPTRVGTIEQEDESIEEVAVMTDEIENQIHDSGAEDTSCKNKTGDNDHESSVLDQTPEPIMNNDDVTHVDGNELSSEKTVENIGSEKLDENEGTVEEGNEDIAAKENDGENHVDGKNGGDDENKNIGANVTPGNHESNAFDEKDEIEKQKPTRNDDMTKYAEEKEDTKDTQEFYQSSENGSENLPSSNAVSSNDAGKTKLSPDAALFPSDDTIDLQQTFTKTAK